MIVVVGGYLFMTFTLISVKTLNNVTKQNMSIEKLFLKTIDEIHVIGIFKSVLIIIVKK